MASLREFLSKNSELHEDADENESGFLGSFAYGETQKNTPFVRLCTDETIDLSNRICEFTCMRQFIKDPRVRKFDRGLGRKVLHHIRFRMGRTGPKSPRAKAQKENQNASKLRSEARDCMKEAHLREALLQSFYYANSIEACFPLAAPCDASSPASPCSPSSPPHCTINSYPSSNSTRY